MSKEANITSKPLPSLAELLQSSNSTQPSVNQTMPSLADLLNSVSSPAKQGSQTKSNSTGMSNIDTQQPQQNIPSLADLLKGNTTTLPTTRTQTQVKNELKNLSSPTLPSLADLLNKTIEKKPEQNTLGCLMINTTKSNHSQLPSLSLMSLSINDAKSKGNLNLTTLSGFENLSLKELADQHFHVKPRQHQKAEDATVTPTKKIAVAPSSYRKTGTRQTTGIKRKPSSFARILQARFIIQEPKQSVFLCTNQLRLDDVDVDTVILTKEMIEGLKSNIVTFDISKPSPDDVIRKKQTTPYERNSK